MKIKVTFILPKRSAKYLHVDPDYATHIGQNTFAFRKDVVIFFSFLFIISTHFLLIISTHFYTSLVYFRIYLKIINFRREKNNQGN